MSQALKAFMASLVDYAGLFPPAALDVAAAVAEYAGHRREPEAWMLGRFIAPAGRLAEIGVSAAPHWGTGPTWAFSVLIGARDTAGAALNNLSTQASQIATFEREYSGQVAVESLEAAIPQDGAERAAEFVPTLLSRLREEGLAQREVYLEVLPGSDPGPVLAAIAAGAATSTTGVDGFSRVGAKLRCGGVTPDAFPTCEHVASVIHKCAGLDLPLKCTAGLHHPVRHQAQEPAVMMHGFLNVFGAALLAWSLKPDLEVLVECVAETDPGAFTFDDETFAWRDYRIAAEDMHRIRSRSLSGFGSCSFAEPRSDLRSLGLL